MRRSRLLVPVLLVAGCLVTLGAAGRPAGAPTDAISVGGLERRLRFIASDALEGRESLSPGFRAAAEYLASELTGLGLTPRGDDGSFLQRVTMRRTSVDPAKTSVEVAGQTFTFGDDLLASGSGSATGRVVYVGHGYRIPSKKIDPFAGVEVKDALLLVLSGTPPGVSARELRALKKGADWWGPEDNARALGARGVIRVAGLRRSVELAAHARTTDVARRPGRGSTDARRGTGPRGHRRPAPAGGAAPRRARKRRAPARTCGGQRRRRRRLRSPRPSRSRLPSAPAWRAKTRSMSLPASRAPTRCCGPSSSRSARTSITSAFAPPGAGRSRRSAPAAQQPSPQPDVINNGADDDGSGVVALVEMAAAAMRGPRPKRSLLFVWHTGEESGGWGSRYITAFPPVPIDRIVAQLNLDMIGRSRRAGDDVAANSALTGPDEVYVVGAGRLSRALADTVASVNRAYLNLTLNPKYDDPGRSRTHLRAERPLPVRAEGHSGRVLLQWPAPGLPPALR